MITPCLSLPSAMISLVERWLAGTSAVCLLSSPVRLSLWWIPLGGGAYGYLSSPDLVTPDFAPGFGCSNALSSGSTQSRLDGYLKTNAFQPAPVAPNGLDDSTGFGDVPRNYFHGPRQLNLDFSVSSRFI